MCVDWFTSVGDWYSRKSWLDLVGWSNYFLTGLKVEVIWFVMSWSFDPIIHFRRWLVLPFWVTVGSDDWFEVIFRHDVISRRLFVIVSLQHAFFLTNLHIKSSSCWHFCTTTRHFLSNSTSRDVFFKTNFALSRPPVDDFCTTTKLFLDMTCSLYVYFRFNAPFSWQICTLSRHLVDIFARWPVTLRLIRRHETSFSRQISQWVILLLIFARRLVTLRLIRHHETTF